MHYLPIPSRRNFGKVFAKNLVQISCQPCTQLKPRTGIKTIALKVLVIVIAYEHISLLLGGAVHFQNPSGKPPYNPLWRAPAFITSFDIDGYDPFLCNALGLREYRDTSTLVCHKDAALLEVE
jgi:hypothetical protein